MIKRGSFTIETACVMPIILFALMGILYQMCIRDRSSRHTAPFDGKARHLETYLQFV